MVPTESAAKTKSSSESEVLDFCNIDILDNNYLTDVACETFTFFSNKGITRDVLDRWQEKYPVLYPWNAKYNLLRQNYNRIYQYYPYMIVMASKTKEIKWALSRALKLKVPFSIRSGGHDWSGLSLSSGIVIDVSRRDYIKICGDTVKVGAGVHIGPLSKELSKNNLVSPFGTCQNVSVVGLACGGGGLGMILRKFGFSIDNLLEVKIVLADSTTVRASKTENKDLFFALRGAGGGNLGIITDLTFQVYPLRCLYLFQVWFPIKLLSKILKQWQAFAPFTDNNLTSELILLTVADLNQDRPEQILFTGEYIGKSKTKLKTLLSPFIQLSVQYKIWKSSFSDAVRHFAIPNPDYYFHNLSAFFNKPLKTKGLNIIKKYLAQGETGMGLEINAMGGKFFDVSPSETAFPWRDAIFWIEFRSGYRSPLLTDKYKTWVYDFYNEMKPYYTNKQGIPMLYANFRDLTLTDDLYPLAYWGNNVKKLVAVKNKYDPNDVFRHPQSIPLEWPPKLDYNNLNEESGDLNDKCEDPKVEANDQSFGDITTDENWDNDWDTAKSKK